MAVQKLERDFNAHHPKHIRSFRVVCLYKAVKRYDDILKRPLYQRFPAQNVDRLHVFLIARCLEDQLEQDSDQKLGVNLRPFGNRQIAAQVFDRRFEDNSQRHLDGHVFGATVAVVAELSKQEDRLARLREKAEGLREGLIKVVCRGGRLLRLAVESL